MPDGWQPDRIRGEKGLLVSEKFVYARAQENICFYESETYGRRRQRWSARMEWSWRREGSPADLMMAQLGSALLRYNISLCLCIICCCCWVLSASPKMVAALQVRRQGSAGRARRTNQMELFVCRALDGKYYYPGNHPPRSPMVLPLVQKQCGISCL